MRIGGPQPVEADRRIVAWTGAGIAPEEPRDLARMQGIERGLSPDRRHAARSVEGPRAPQPGRPELAFEAGRGPSGPAAGQPGLDPERRRPADGADEGSGDQSEAGPRSPDPPFEGVVPEGTARQPLIVWRARPSRLDTRFG